MSATRIHARDTALAEAAATGAAGDSVTCPRVQAARADRTARALRTATQIFRDACAKHPGGQAGVARALGVSKSRVNKWCDESEDLSIPTHHLLALAETCPSVFEAFIIRLDQHAKAPPPQPLPATLDESVYRARCELADVDRLLTPGSTHSLDQLRVLEDEAEEAAAAAALVLEHTRSLIAGRIAH